MDKAKVKKIVFDDTDIRHAQLRIRLQNDGLSQAEFFRAMITGYIEKDKNIIKYFGTIDDFLLTSMASQLGSLVFINEGSTKRKEILAKFLDLDLLEKKFKTAKEDASDLKVIINA